MSSPQRRRWRLVALPVALFLVVSGVVFGLAQAVPFEKDAGGGEALAPGDATRGAMLFATSCAGCHGADASGGTGPALRGNPIGLIAARGVIRSGRGVMPAGLVSGTDEADVLAFLRTILASP